MADEAPDVTQPVDPKILESLMSGIGTGAVQGPPPSLQQQANTNQQITSAPTPAPDMSATSQMPQQLAQIIQSISSGPQQAATQQQTQQSEAERQIASGVPKPRPIALDLISSLTGKNFGGPNVPGYKPPSKLEHFESFLGNFLTALSAGFANEGHGPGAAMRGAGAAMQAPYQQALQQYGLQQQQQVQQAQIAAEQAKTEQTRRQTDLMGQMVTVQTPNGTVSMPYQIAMKAYPASVTGQFGVKKEEIKAENKLEVEVLRQKLIQGTASKFIPDADPNGRMFYHVYNKFGKEIGQADVNAIAQFTGKTTATTELKQQEDGSYIRVPKVTMSQPVIPNRHGVTGSIGVPNSSMPIRKSGSQFWATSDSRGGVDKMAAVPVLDATGRPVFGKAPENIRTMAYTAEATVPHIPIILDEIDELEKMGLLGEFKGKMTNYLTGKGFAQPGLTQQQREAIGKFVNDVKLMDSAMLRTHFGARGGQTMYEKFSEMLNAGEDPDIMRGGLQSFNDFLSGYGKMMNMHSSAPAAPGTNHRPPGW